MPIMWSMSAQITVLTEANMSYKVPVSTEINLCMGRLIKITRKLLSQIAISTMNTIFK